MLKFTLYLNGFTMEYQRSNDIAVTVKTDTLLMAYTKYCEKTRRQNKSPATPVRTGKESPSITSVGVTRIQTPATDNQKLVILALTTPYKLL